MMVYCCNCWLLRKLKAILSKSDLFFTLAIGANFLSLDLNKALMKGEDCI